MAQSASFKVLSITGLYSNETLKRRIDSKTKFVEKHTNSISLVLF